MLITVDNNFKIVTGMYLVLAALAFLFAKDGIFPGIAMMILAIMPLVHEGAHIYIARDYGLPVDEVRLIRGKTETVISGVQTHEEVFAIAGAGAVIDGVFFTLIGVIMAVYAVRNGIPLAVSVGFFVLMVSLFLASVGIENSDLRIALAAWTNFRAQKEA